MKVVKCDCRDCNNIGIELNKITVTSIDGNTKSYDLCDNCLNRILNILVNTPETVAKTPETVVNTPETVANTPETVVKTRPNVKKIIENYGIDRLKEEYITKGRTAKDLANEMGISKIALAQHLCKLGISKKSIDKKESMAENCEDKKEGD